MLAYTTPEPLCQLMCPFTVFEKAGAKNVAIKCQTEEFGGFVIFFKGRDMDSINGPPSIVRSIHLLIYSSSNARMLEEIQIKSPS